MQSALLALRSIHRNSKKSKKNQESSTVDSEPEVRQVKHKAADLASESKIFTRGIRSGVIPGTKNAKQNITVASETKVSTLGSTRSAKTKRQRTASACVPERKVASQSIVTTLQSKTKKATPKTAVSVSGSISETKASSQSVLTPRNLNTRSTSPSPVAVKAACASDENVLVHGVATACSLDPKNSRSRIASVHDMRAPEVKTCLHNVGTNFTPDSRKPAPKPSTVPSTSVSKTKLLSPAVTTTVTRDIKNAPLKQAPTSTTCVLEKTTSSLSTSTATFFTSDTKDWSQDMAAFSTATCSEEKDLGTTRRAAERRAAKTYTCPVCQKEFPWLSSLKSHMRTHKGERLYKCDECAYATNKCSDYFAHLRLHMWRQTQSEGAATRDGLGQQRAQSLDRPFKCRMGEFAPAHSRSVHALAGDSPQQNQQPPPPAVFKCAECQAEFVSRKSYTRHVNTVHGNPLQ